MLKPILSELNLYLDNLIKMIIKEKITYKDVKANPFEGVIVWDDSIKEAKPGILVSHMWSGQSDFEVDKATELAKLGYVGFAIDNYGKGRRANGPEEAQKLMDELKQYPDSDKLIETAKNLKITIEMPDARDPKYAGLYLLWHPKQVYAAIKTLRKSLKTDRIFMTIDWEHIAGSIL